MDDSVAHWSGWAYLAVLVYVARASLESVLGTCVGPFKRLREVPALSALATTLNDFILQRCPTLQEYTAAPWAPGGISQTVLGMALNNGSSEYPRREIVTAPDGVELLCDFKDPEGATDDTPILFICHGIGGDSSSRLSCMLSDVMVKHGWRAVVYNRRGHGKSTLLPAPLVPPPSPAGLSLPKGLTKSVSAQHLSSLLNSATASLSSLMANTRIAVRRASQPGSSSMGPLAGPSPSPTTSTASTVATPCTTSHAQLDHVMAPHLVADAAGAALEPPELSFAGALQSQPPGAASELLGKGGSVPGKHEEGPAPASPVVLSRKEALLKVTKVFPRHSDTDDMAAVARHLANLYPSAPKVALGFSQGSNVVCQYLGMHAADPPPFSAAISISNAYDLVFGTTELQRDWVTNAVITRPLKRLLRKELAAVRELRDARDLPIDLEKALGAQGIREFDSALLVPAYGFRTVDEYYATQSSKGVLKDIKTPLLLLNNQDDPIIPPCLALMALKAAQHNPYLIAACTQRGGHLGWLQGWGGQPWLADLVLQYCQATADAVATGLLPPPATLARPPLQVPSGLPASGAAGEAGASGSYPLPQPAPGPYDAALAMTSHNPHTMQLTQALHGAGPSLAGRSSIDELQEARGKRQAVAASMQGAAADLAGPSSRQEQAWFGQGPDVGIGLSSSSQTAAPVTASHAAHDATIPETWAASSAPRAVHQHTSPALAPAAPPPRTSTAKLPTCAIDIATEGSCSPGTAATPGNHAGGPHTEPAADTSGSSPEMRQQQGQGHGVGGICTPPRLPTQGQAAQGLAPGLVVRGAAPGAGSLAATRNAGPGTPREALLVPLPASPAMPAQGQGQGTGAEGIAALAALAVGDGHPSAAVTFTRCASPASIRIQLTSPAL